MKLKWVLVIGGALLATLGLIWFFTRRASAAQAPAQPTWAGMTPAMTPTGNWTAAGAATKAANDAIASVNNALSPPASNSFGTPKVWNGGLTNVFNQFNAAKRN